MHTRYLAIEVAEAARGVSLTWSEHEVARIFSNFRANPPESNRDPNFLKDSEMAQSPWFQAMRTCKQMLHLLSRSPTARTLHCDIHGMSDVSIPGVDCVFGTAAIEQHHGRHRASRFRNNLERFVGAALATFPTIFEYTPLSAQETKTTKS